MGRQPTASRAPRATASSWPSEAFGGILLALCQASLMRIGSIPFLGVRTRSGLTIDGVSVRRNTTKVRVKANSHNARGPGGKWNGSQLRMGAHGNRLHADPRLGLFAESRRGQSWRGPFRRCRGQSDVRGHLLRRRLRAEAPRHPGRTNRPVRERLRARGLARVEHPPHPPDLLRLRRQEPHQALNLGKVPFEPPD